MASLIEELIVILEDENNEYEKLVSLSKEKTTIIIKGDINELKHMVVKEQLHVDRIVNLENKRTEVVNDIGIVLNKEASSLTIKAIVDLLQGQEKEQHKLSLVHDKLKRTLKDMVTINDMNKGLLKESLEMIEFNINLINSLNQMPDMANYSKNAYNVSSQFKASGFDAKQ